MQNRYAGDVGDFGKFGLLNKIFDAPKWKIGVVWYLYPDENHNDDGRYIEYLSKKEFIWCNENLADKLSKVVRSGRRNVKELERVGVLKSNTVYFDECLDFYHRFPGQTKKNKNIRLKLRKKWLAKAIEMTSACNVLFVDPDNGIEISSCPKLNQSKSGKYIYYSEIERLFQYKDVMVIYHHLNRHKNHGSHREQIERRAKELKMKNTSNFKVFAIRFKPYSPRAYFILCRHSCETEIRNNLNDFLHSPWSNHWDSYYEI
jgi:hypothetical protein